MAKRFNEINEEETLYMFILVRHLPSGKSLLPLQITNNLIAPTGFSISVVQSSALEHIF